ncbi:MAG: imidazole glycerol phosphate synthase subunit HisF [Candidatus Muiribacterium halophilum]|uniref:imidazole glycerol-phosphate synthase n=1 Tax=Muiribacterium halophilum TaxID=2053465 RepID=A0A2N5ZJ94_MUIH1|nr:MAG: imidazole glycerol phosphate synthase subunit HisF [Candidatus Muirbacterium halophilum]
MLRTRVMPCLLLDNGSLVKTVRFKKYNYIGDPINAVRIYNEFEVDELLLLDIKAGIEKKEPDYKLIEEIAGECFMPLSYGGGINNIKQIERLFNIGVEKVSINSAAYRNNALIKDASENFGSQSIIISMDVKNNIFGKRKVCIDSGKKITRTDPVLYSFKMQQLGAGEILINSIDRDGTWKGYDIDLIKSVSDKVDIPVIACGGAANISDFEKAVKNAGASSVAAGSMFVYQGKDLGVLINFPEREILEKSLI